MNRRKYLAISGGMIALAGCSSDSNNDQSGEENQESESTNGGGSDSDELEEQSDGEGAIFEFNRISPDGETYTTDEEIEMEVWVENTGASSGEQTIEFYIGDEQLGNGSFEIDSGEETNVGLTESGSNFEVGTYEFEARSEDDKISSTFTIEKPETDSEPTDSTYAVRISYDGDWSGSIAGDGSSRSVDGSGTETFDVDGDPFIVSANAQKEDNSNDELTVEILEDGEVIAQESTTASYGIAQVTSEDENNTNGDDSGESSDSGTTFSVRIDYSGEWSGAIGGDGSTRSVDGSGTETFEIDGNPSIITANAQKQEANSDELVVQILEDGEVVKENSTTAEYGLAQVTYSNF